MKPAGMNKTVLSQRGYFNTGITREVSFRINALKTLERAIKRREKEIKGGPCKGPFQAGV